MGNVLLIIIVILALYIIHQQNIIIMEQSEAAVKLTAVANQLVKIKAEVQALKDALETADDVSPELQAAIENVITVTQATDDINPDVVPPAEPTA